MHLFLLRTLVSLAATGALLPGQPPPGYYATVDDTNAQTLRTTLHDVIDNHTVRPYTSGSTDTWDVLEWADQDPSNSSRIVSIYENQSFQKSSGSRPYNREHVWPRSYGFPNENSDGPFTDCHMLRLADPSYNSARSNKPYDNCDAQCAEYDSLLTNGVGGGVGVFPGNSNWTEGGFTSGSWQVWAHRKGDIARSLLYMDVRYEGDVGSEPDLILTDDRQLIANSNTGQNEAVAYMGILSVLVQWHEDDPPDAGEVERNDRVAFYQGNRNPFVDHPEWVDILWGDGGDPVPGAFARYGTGCPRNVGGTPVIAEVSNPLIGQNLTLIATGAPFSAPGAVHVDFVPSAIDLGVVGFPGCDLLALPTLASAASSNPGGLAFLSVPIANSGDMIGVSWYTQFLFLEFSPPNVATTGGAQFTFGSP